MGRTWTRWLGCNHPCEIDLRVQVSEPYRFCHTMIEEFLKCNTKERLGCRTRDDDSDDDHLMNHPFSGSLKALISVLGSLSLDSRVPAKYWRAKQLATPRYGGRMRTEKKTSSKVLSVVHHTHSEAT